MPSDEAHVYIDVFDNKHNRLIWEAEVLQARGFLLSKTCDIGSCFLKRHQSFLVSILIQCKESIVNMIKTLLCIFWYMFTFWGFKKPFLLSLNSFHMFAYMYACMLEDYYFFRSSISERVEKKIHWKSRLKLKKKVCALWMKVAFSL